jgi:hypothetical protein
VHWYLLGFKLPQPPDPDIVKQMLSYFVRNPSAVDSVEGIARWRLLEEQIERTVRETETALEWLLAEGYLLEVRRPGTERLYQLNLKRRSKAIEFLGVGAKSQGRSRSK